MDLKTLSNEELVQLYDDINFYYSDDYEGTMETEKEKLIVNTQQLKVYEEILLRMSKHENS